jgi:membrane fusion protein, multidrug efflux system
MSETTSPERPVPTAPASAAHGTPGPLAPRAAGTPLASAGLDGEVLPPRRRSAKGRVLLVILLAAAAFGGWRGYGWFTEGRFIVSTEDAYVRADVTTVAAKVPGYVMAVPLANNTAVKAGDVIARIDDGDYRNAVDAAKARLATQAATIQRLERQVEAQTAALGQSRAQIVAAEADQARADADFQRAQALAQSDYGSRQRLDAARADRDKTVAAADSARAAIEAAQASIGVTRAQQTEAVQVLGELRTTLARAERDLGFTVVTAPVDGVLGNRAAEIGNYVQAGTRLAALIPLGSTYVEANFKETQLARLKPGQAVDIEVDALPGRVIEGTVQSVAPAAGSVFSLLPPENATGNFTKIVQRVPVRIAVTPEVARSGVLRPGLSVVAAVRTRDPDAPVSALETWVTGAVAAVRDAAGIAGPTAAEGRSASVAGH